MKAGAKSLQRLAIGAAVCAAVVVGLMLLGLMANALGLTYPSIPPNDLGLTGMDYSVGGKVDPGILRAKVVPVAEAYMRQQRAELERICGGSFESTLDFGLQGWAQALGYRSSFYFYCWNIYVPYAVKSRANSFVVLVQLDDKVPQNATGDRHDIDHFRVVRGVVLDGKGMEIARLE